MTREFGSNNQEPEPTHTHCGKESKKNYGSRGQIVISSYVKRRRAGESRIPQLQDDPNFVFRKDSNEAARTQSAKNGTRSESQHWKHLPIR